jgi:hypothetical protein
VDEKSEKSAEMQRDPKSKRFRAALTANKRFIVSLRNGVADGSGARRNMSRQHRNQSLKRAPETKAAACLSDDN